MSTLRIIHPVMINKPQSRKHLLISLLIWAFLLSGCGQASPSPTVETPPATVISTSTPVPRETPREQSSPTPEPDPEPTALPMKRPQYQISAALNYPQQQVFVTENIRIPHPAQIPLDEIILAAPINAWPGVFWIEELDVDPLNMTGYELDGVQLRIDLDFPGWQPGTVLEIKIRYRLDLPQQNARQGYGPSPFGYTVLQTNLVDWYPMVVPYQEDNGWLIHDPWLFGEYLVYPAADFVVELDLNGSGLVAAASAPAEEREGIFHYALDSARNFVISLSPSYIVLEDEVDGIKVYGYIFPGYQVPGQAAFTATIEALRLYSDLYGQIQQPSLSMIQADFNHGMEYEGLYFQSKGFFDTYGGSVESYLIAIAVHETAHQWWYGRVANDQALEPWLDEALCTFSELAYYQGLYPQSEDWWWGTRVNFYQPEGPINRSIYAYAGYADQYLAYRNATYLQGAKFLFFLKEEMGEDQFYDFLREYAWLYQDQIASGEDFFSLLEEYQDLVELDWLGEYFQ